MFHEALLLTCNISAPCSFCFPITTRAHWSQASQKPPEGKTRADPSMYTLNPAWDSAITNKDLEVKMKASWRVFLLLYFSHILKKLLFYISSYQKKKKKKRDLQSLAHLGRKAKLSNSTGIIQLKPTTLEQSYHIIKAPEVAFYKDLRKWDLTRPVLRSIRIAIRKPYTPKAT